MAELILTTTSGSLSKIYRTVDGVTFDEIDAGFKILELKTVSLTQAIALDASNKLPKYSVDSGSTWQDATGLPYTSIWKVRGFQKITSSLIYLVVEPTRNSIRQLYKSEDGGATYTRVGSVSGFLGFNFSWADQDTGYAIDQVSPNNVWKTTNSGASWSNVGQLPNGVTATFGIDLLPFSSGIVYIGVRGVTNQLFKSTNGGTTWVEKPGFPMLNGTLKALDENTLYGPGSDGFLQTSIDGGDTWVTKPMIAFKSAFFLDSNVGYTTDNGNIYKTTDFGATYELPNPYYTKPIDGRFLVAEMDGDGGVPGCTNPNAYNTDAGATSDDGSCLFAFKLTDTQNPANILLVDPLLGDDPFPYLGQAVKINGDVDTCYTVEYYTAGAGTVGVTIDADFADASTCELSVPIYGPTDPNAYNYDDTATVSDGSELYAYRLTDSKGVAPDIVSDSAFLDSLVGDAVKLAAPYDNVCYLVEYETDVTGITLPFAVTYDSDYPTGAACELTLPTGYRLTDVSGNEDDILTSSDLSAQVGQVIKIDQRNICWLVSVEDPLVGDVAQVTVQSVYADGDACLLTFDKAHGEECEVEEEEVPAPRPLPTPASLNDYYQSKYKLDQIVREFIIERGEDTEHNYPRFLQLAVNGLRELNMDISGHSKMVVLTIKDDMTVDLPQDFINYTKISICGANGELMSLGYNPKLCMPRHQDECGNIVHGHAQTRNTGYIGVGVYVESVASHFRNGEMVGRFYGAGGGQNANGEYRLDKERGVLQLSSVDATEIVLEYLADITKIDGSFVVHPYIIETIKAYMAWSSIRRKRSVPLQEVEMARRDYYNERRIAVQRFSSFTIDEAMATIRKAFKLAPKL